VRCMRGLQRVTVCCNMLQCVATSPVISTCVFGAPRMRAATSSVVGRSSGCVLQCVAVSVLQSVCCSQCVAVHCSALQCDVVRCILLQFFTVCCSVLQCVAVFCVCSSVLKCAAVCSSVFQCVTACYSVLQCVAGCCIMLQRVAASSVVGRCSGCMSQCIAVYCSIWHVL